jgi:hypothetical protein
MAQAVTFWYGCNVLRHGDIIRGCLDILRLLGFEPRPAGGPDYCCGNVKEANQQAADGMARRTVARFNALGRARLVVWCPSCHAHMSDFMSQAYAAGFSLSYFVDVLHEHRGALAPLLRQPVPLRVLLHRHAGFNDYANVNQKVPELLRLIPGLEVIEDGYRAPGYMCASLAAVPAAMGDMVRHTLRLARDHRAAALVTVFHQCHRELCGLEAHAAMPVYNYVQLLARSLGLDYPDEYKEWKKAGADAGALIGAARLERVGIKFFERAVLPELMKRPAGLTNEEKK